MRLRHSLHSERGCVRPQQIEDPMMRMATALLAALLASGATSTALAQSKGFYVGGALGYTSPRDSDVRGNGIARTDSYESALSGAGVVGYAHGNGVRTEIELSVRNNDVDRVTGTGAGSGAGAIGATSGMLNLLYDLRPGAALTPYVGIGAGLAYVTGDGARSTTAGTGSIKGSDTEPAYQLIAGVAYALADRVTLALDYRFLSTFQEPDLDLRFASGASRNVSVDYASHSFMLGLRYQFAPPAMAAAASAPAPRPAPAPAPAPAAAPTPARAQTPDIQRSFLVFFDFDKSDITAQAERVIVQAAEHAKRGGVARIVVTGHADTSGPAPYNQRLSERRAAAVRDALQRNGMQAAAISTLGKGESEPLVNTGDGVREAQNRRAEIVLR
jgi:outer membrane protein OmpA-like peptidoglycan-associated protein